MSVNETLVCLNGTALGEFLRAVVYNASREAARARENRREVEGDPLVYIVAVLLFYSCGIAVLMINYMKKEQNDDVETALYKQYVDKRSRCNSLNAEGGGAGGGGGNDEKSGGVHRLALNALNAVNAISQDGAPSQRVAFV